MFLFRDKTSRNEGQILHVMLASKEQDFQTWKEREDLFDKNEEEKRKERKVKGRCARPAKWPHMDTHCKVLVIPRKTK